MKKPDLDLGADSHRPCYISDCRSGEAPKRNRLCCDHHRVFEHQARFNVKMALIFAEGEMEQLAGIEDLP